MKLKGKKSGGIISASTNSLWAGVTEDDFIHEKDIEDREIGDFDKENMTLFIANSNLFRHLTRLSDSLKPVERRGLMSAQLVGAKPGNKTKCAVIISNMMKYHPHGDSVCYGVLVNMAQPWKRPCPLISGKGNFGNAANPDLFAHYRYTEATLSKYAQECFFSDYDEDCVETMFNSSADTEEPMSLPTKFPNILVNGGMGIAVGNNYRIPPYNIDDIIAVVGRVLKNPQTTDVFMIPDFPCDCDIIDDGQELHNVIDYGQGNIITRGRISIEPYGNGWMLRITSVPWLVNFQNVLAKIRTLASNGILAISDIQEANEPVKTQYGVETKIDTRIIISGAHDPNVIREKLYSMTDLEKVQAINFKVVTDNLEVKRFNMKDLIQTWIDERRFYKRRLFNKRLTKIDARLDLLEILIYLTEAYNLDKTVHVIRDSNDADIPANLMKLCKMSSYQARRIADMGLRAFSKDAHGRYLDEQSKLKKERKEVLSIVESEQKIDAIILEELEDLRKYGSPRRTNVYEPTTGNSVADTEHHLIVTKDGLVKKLMYTGSYSVPMGSFRAGDYPVYRSIFHNMDSAIFFDSFGRYSIIPIHEIDNNEPSQYGHNLYTLTKLSGKIVTVEKFIGEDALDTLSKIGTPYLITVTSGGYIKKTPLAEYFDVRSTKNIRCMKIRDDDSLAYAGIILSGSNIIVYTKNGNYVYLSVDSISEQAKDSMGLISMKIDGDDQVVGVSVINPKDEYIAVITNKGIVKRCETKYLGSPVIRSASNSHSYLTTLEVADSVYCVMGLQAEYGLAVCTRTDIYHLDANSIPIATRKAKGKKLVPLPSGSNILNVFEEKPLDEEEATAITATKPKAKAKKPKKKKKK